MFQVTILSALCGFLAIANATEGDWGVAFIAGLMSTLLLFGAMVSKSPDPGPDTE